MNKVPVLGQQITYVDTDTVTEAAIYRTGLIIERPTNGVNYDEEPLLISYFTEQGTVQLKAKHGSAQGDWMFAGEYGVR
jgi:hypothetical protein